jgi:hypothetical protein
MGRRPGRVHNLFTFIFKKVLTFCQLYGIIIVPNEREVFFMSKNVVEVFTDKVLVVHCKPLNDQWECDCERTPVMVVDKTMARKYYYKYGYEWYAIKPNGALHLIKGWEDE